MFEDIFDAETQARREAERARVFEQERHAACQLLRHRGHQGAALIVAACAWRSDCVDNWDGGQYEVEISVPAELYDAAREHTVLSQLTAAAEAVTGSGHFRDLLIALKRGPAPAGWDVEIAQDILRAERSRRETAAIEGAA